ncbi:MAG: hypothetical protein R3C14_15210 [Caldilineaceae bacterium]
MTSEYTYLQHHVDFPDAGYAGEQHPGMTIQVERHSGKEGGHDGSGWNSRF